jgi:hypothetical protein
MTIVRSLEEAKEDLAEEYFPRVASAIRSALSDFVAEHASLRFKYSTRTEASIIHDYMVYGLRGELAGLPGLSFTVKRGLFLICIKQRWMFRAKRLDNSLRSRNILTQQVLDFLGQVQLEIPGAEGPTHLNVGYQGAGVELVASHIWVTCPIKKDLAWTWELIDGEETQTSPASVPTAPLPVIQPILTVEPVVANHQVGQEEASSGASNAGE